MCRRATFAIAMSSTSMKAARDTTLAINQGLRLPAADRSGVQPSVMSAHPDSGHDGHAGAEWTFAWHLVEQDLYRYPLDNLDEVAGGVLRGQQGEGLTSAPLDRIDVSGNGNVGAGVDTHVYGLAGSHAS